MAMLTKNNNSVEGRGKAFGGELLFRGHHVMK